MLHAEYACSKLRKKQHTDYLSQPARRRARYVCVRVCAFVCLCVCELGMRRRTWPAVLFMKVHPDMVCVVLGCKAPGPLPPMVAVMNTAPPVSVALFPYTHTHTHTHAQRHHVPSRFTHTAYGCIEICCTCVSTEKAYDRHVVHAMMEHVVLTHAHLEDCVCDGHRHS